MSYEVISDLLTILGTGLVANLISRRLGASTLIGYLIAGVIIGKGVLGWVQDEQHQIEHFAEVGVFLLLFSIGIEFALDDAKRLARNLLIGGAAQMALVAVPVGLALSALGMSWQSAAVVAAAIAFSSTVLVFKALNEYGQSEKPLGQMAIGILLFQDAALIPLLLMVPILTGDQNSISVPQLALLGIVSIVSIATVIALRELMSRVVVPMITRFRSPDLFVLFVLSSLGGITFVAYQVGLPPAVGAFAAGLIFNGNRWTHQIDSLVLPFRETFAAIFFVGLGLLFDVEILLREPITILLSLVAVILTKAIAGTIALLLSGLNLRKAVGVGLGLAHVGEFAFVLMLLAVQTNTVSEPVYQRVVAIAIGSLILTPPIMRLGLRFAQSMDSELIAADHSPGLIEGSDSAIVIGAGPVGRRVAAQLETAGRDVCLIDLSPINLHAFGLAGFRTVAGDATKEQTLQYAMAGKSAMIAVCVPIDETALAIVRSVRKLNATANVVVRCRYQANVNGLRSAGANQVVSEETEASLALLQIVETLNETAK